MFWLFGDITIRQEIGKKIREGCIDRKWNYRLTKKEERMVQLKDIVKIYNTREK